MAFKRTTKRAGGWAKKAAPAEAPSTWVQLLEEVATKPGVISAAFRAFHSYSIGNAVLALYQASSRGLEIGPMAAYGKWQSLGRQVKKGEKAIWLNVPRTFKKKATDVETGEETEARGMYFSLRPATFLYCQTDPVEGQTDRSASLAYDGDDWDQDRALAALDVRLAPFSKLNGNLMGYLNPNDRTIHVSPVNPHPSRTILHELAHAILHIEGYAACESRGIAEAEAESVAMLVASSLGLGGAEESRAYVQSWLARTDRQDLDEKIARRIFSAANRILQAGRQQAEEAQEAA